MVCFWNPSHHSTVFIDSSAIDDIKDRSDLHLFFERKHMVFRSPSIEKEVNHPNTPETVKEPFKGINWFTCDTPLNNQEKRIKNGIFEIMQGNATKKDHSNDALHIFYAAKDEGYLIAVDKRIIKKRDQISNYLFDEQFGTFKIKAFRFIFTPDEFVKISKC